MIYGKFGKTGAEVSSLGFGAMRLPMKEIDGKRIVDEDAATRTIRRAFDLGVNYIDTAPYYCDSQSEAAVGKAVKGYRDKVYVSTKNPVEDDGYSSFMKRLEKSLKNLDMDYIDFYHMWGINLEAFKTKINKPDGPIGAALKAKEEGLIKHISFSYHDKPENMKEIIDTGYFESVLMQYNLLDRSNEKNIDYAAEKGLGVVIMGPVGGGRLGAPSPVIKNLLGNKIKSTAEMALRFVMANKNVSVALSGMENIQMVEENAAVASIEGHLTESEAALVSEMLQESKKLADLYCTGCRYCMPCEQGVDIPYIFTLMNYHKVYGLTDYSVNQYSALYNESSKRKPASNCIECGACVEKCPQKIDIVKQLKDVEKELAKGGRK